MRWNRGECISLRKKSLRNILFEKKPKGESQKNLQRKWILEQNARLKSTLISRKWLIGLFCNAESNARWGEQANQNFQSNKLPFDLSCTSTYRRIDLDERGVGQAVGVQEVLTPIRTSRWTINFLTEKVTWAGQNNAERHDQNDHL